MSRPMLGLILMQASIFKLSKIDLFSKKNVIFQPEQYEALKQDILNTPTLDQAQREKLNIVRKTLIFSRKFMITFQGFDQLMQRVETNLTVRNKDNFTQNLSKFRKVGRLSSFLERSRKVKLSGCE